MMVLAGIALLALHLPTPLTTGTMSRRQAVLAIAAPLAASSAGPAHAFNPLDALFGWIPPVESTDKVVKQDSELTTAEKIRRRRKQLEQEEAAKLQAEYEKNRAASAASRAVDVAGASR